MVEYQPGKMEWLQSDNGEPLGPWVDRVVAGWPGVESLMIRPFLDGVVLLPMLLSLAVTGRYCEEGISMRGLSTAVQHQLNQVCVAKGWSDQADSESSIHLTNKGVWVCPVPHSY